MINKDNIQDLFSKAFENQTAPVRPELWAGVQAKMAAAGVTSVVAAKGLSALAKWVIGSAAVATVGVVTTYVVLQGNENGSTRQQKTAQVDKKTKETNTPEEVAQTHTESGEKQSAVSGLFVPPMVNNNTSVSQFVTKEETPKQVVIMADVPNESVTNQKTNTESEKLAVITNTDVNNGVTEVPKEAQANKAAEVPSVDMPKAKITNFPNVFTPNNDGNNDFYEIEAEHLSSVKVIILDTKNKVVFETNDLNFKWDGTYQGVALPKGTFACVVTGLDPQGKSFRQTQLLDLQ